jgi:DNA adenine methylase
VSAPSLTLGRTPLTYYGGKQRLAAQIVARMPEHRVYLEPFCGGAAVLFAKARVERETLNDLDGDVAAFWRVVRDHPLELADTVACTPYSRAEWIASRESATDDLERARRLLVRIDQSFSRSGKSWSVPCIGDGRGRWQPGSWENLPPKIVAAAERLRGVALECRDALWLIPRWDRPDAVIYCDPPYAGVERLEPRHGYAVDDAECLWPRLVETLLEVEHAAVILSGYPCEAADRLILAGWRVERLERKRTVQARSGESLAAAPELVWLSPAVSEIENDSLWPRADERSRNDE